VPTVDPFATNGPFAGHSSKPASRASVVKIDPIKQFDPSKIWGWAWSVWLQLTRVDSEMVNPLDRNTRCVCQRLHGILPLIGCEISIFKPARIAA
jgi:hypothetical protein